MLYAHSLENRPESDWEPLERHLCEVAKLAGIFAASFSAEDWGRVAGLWHDLGKARPEFQALLRGAQVRVEHAGLGAALADSKPGVLRSVLAFVIAGHHSGLSNEETRAANGLAPLRERLARNRRLLPILTSFPGGICDPPVPAPPAWIRAIADLPTSSAERRRRLHLSIDMFVRFLLSALVDADRLATERFVDWNAARDQPWPDLATISARLDTHVAALQVATNRRTPVNLRRDEVLQTCRSSSPWLMSPQRRGPTAVAETTTSARSASWLR
jgi:CRISPR-associated endonuclease/helicase Cas3